MKKNYVEKEIEIVPVVLFVVALTIFPLSVLAARGKISAAWLLLPICLYIVCAVFWQRWIVFSYKRAKRAMSLFASGYSLKSFGDEKNPLFPEFEAIQKRLDSIVDADNMMALSKRQAQFLALQNQINPHFLYNTLEGIRSEALIAGLESVANMAEAMSRFFRYTISGGENLVTLGMELENTETYFFIQKYRFGSKLHFEIEMDEEDRTRALKCRFPKLTMQPIVENAILHGLECKEGEGHLKIKVLTTETRLLVTVSDDGGGMDEETLSKLQERLAFHSFDNNSGKAEGKHSGIALGNVNKRIKILFGEEYGLTVESTLFSGTDVHISLPLSTEDAV